MKSISSHYSDHVCSALQVEIKTKLLVVHQMSYTTHTTDV